MSFLRENGLSIRVHSAWEEVTSLKAEWAELSEVDDSVSVFQTWEWMDAWCHAYDVTSASVILCIDARDKIQGMVPFQRTKWPRQGVKVFSILRLLGDGTGDCGGLGWITRPGSENEVLKAVLQWFEEDRCADALDLNWLAPTSAECLRTALLERKWEYGARTAAHHQIALPGSWHEFLQCLSPDKRRSVLSVRRKAERHKIEFCRCDDAEQVPYFLRQLERLHTSRWRARNIDGAFNDPRRRKFYLDLATRFLSRNLLDLWLMKMDGVIVAAEFGAVFRNKRISIQSGFDPDYAKHGVGTLLDAKLIELAIAAGICEYDFLGGDQSFKRRWGAIPGNYHLFRCAPRRSKGSLWMHLAKARDGLSRKLS